MAINLSTKNFNKTNTPKLLKNIADGLLYSSPIITGMIMGFPLEIVMLKAWLIYGWSSFVSLFKIVSKLFGVHVESV